MVSDLAHQDVGAELLHLVADDLDDCVLEIVLTNKKYWEYWPIRGEYYLVDGGPGWEGVPGVGAGVGDGAGH